MADEAPPASSDTGGIPTRSLPTGGFRRLTVLLGRALRRRCPYCGSGGIFDGWFSLRERCPTCGAVFEREDGYFLGAYGINLLFALFVGLGGALLLIFGTPLRDAALIWQEAVAVLLAVVLPILVFPYSRTLWMALDLQVDPPGRQTERRLRGHEMKRERGRWRGVDRAPGRCEAADPVIRDRPHGGWPRIHLGACRTVRSCGPAA